MAPENPEHQCFPEDPDILEHPSILEDPANPESLEDLVGLDFLEAPEQ